MNRLAPMAASRTTLSGASALRKLLQEERSTIARTPLLIITSQLDESAPKAAFVEQVDHACRYVEHATTMQSGLRTISSPIVSAFPLVQDVQSRVDLTKRTGAATILGVGSGAAMDLAKSVIANRDDVRGILVPSTYRAILAATSSHSLLWDAASDCLVPQDAKNDADTTVVLQPNALAKTESRHAAWACLTIGLDALQRNGGSPEVDLVLSSALEALDDSKDKDDCCTNAVAQAGHILSFGLEDTRSAPLALAASLIPTSFPSSRVLTFMATLLPGLCQVHSASSDVEERVLAHCQSHLHEIPTLASLVAHGDAALSVPSLLSHVSSNQVAWNCLDVDPQLLEAILHHSLNR